MQVTNNGDGTYSSDATQEAFTGSLTNNSGTVEASSDAQGTDANATASATITDVRQSLANQTPSVGQNATPGVNTASSQYGTASGSGASRSAVVSNTAATYDSNGNVSQTARGSGQANGASALQQAATQATTVADERLESEAFESANEVRQ